MMRGPMGGAAQWMGTETRKPKSTLETLNRFWHYFRHYWFALVLVVVLLLVNVWSQVQAPEILGQAVDCYLFRGPGSNCWFSNVAADAPLDVKVAGLGTIVLTLLALYILGSITAGLMFYSMTWTG